MAPKKKKGIAAMAPMKRAMKVALPSLGDKSKAEVAPPKETQKRQALPLVSPMKRARRINNAAADRALKTKFWWLPTEYLDGLEMDGTTPADDVAEELSRLGPTENYVCYDFWLQLDEKWSFRRGHAFDNLPAPETSEVVRKELSEAVQLPTTSNPSARSVGKLKKFVDCDGMNLG